MIHAHTGPLLGSWWNGACTLRWHVVAEAVQPGGSAPRSQAWWSSCSWRICNSVPQSPRGPRPVLLGRLHIRVQKVYLPLGSRRKAPNPEQPLFDTCSALSIHTKVPLELQCQRASPMCTWTSWGSSVVAARSLSRATFRLQPLGIFAARCCPWKESHLGSRVILTHGVLGHAPKRGPAQRTPKNPGVQPQRYTRAFSSGHCSRRIASYIWRDAVGRMSQPWPCCWAFRGVRDPQDHIHVSTLRTTISGIRRILGLGTRMSDFYV